MNNICNFTPIRLTVNEVNERFKLIQKNLCYILSQTSAGFLGSAANGLSVSSTTVVLGQDLSQVGNPAILTSNREIPFNGFRLGFSGNARFGLGTNFPVTRFHINDTTNNPTFGGNVIAAGRNTMLVNADMTTLGSCCTTDINILTTGNTNIMESQLLLTRARGTTDTPVMVQSGDSLGSIVTYGYGGASMIPAGSIRFIVDNTTSLGVVPTAITLNTGTTSRIERMRIASTGAVGVGTTSPTAKLHLGGGTATANTSPLKFDAGINLTTPEAGVVEYDGFNFYQTNGIAIRGVFEKTRTNVSSAGTLGLTAVYSDYIFSGTTTTWTLPALAGNTNVKFYIKNRGSGAITLNSNAGGNDIYNTSAINTFTINPGEAIILVNDGTFWNIE